VATVADVPALLDLIHSAYRGDSSRAGWTSEADLLDGSRIDEDLLHKDLTDPATSLFVVENPPGEGAGLLACAALVDRGGGTAYFGTFAVRPTAQGRGTGNALLAHAEAHARAAGAVRLEMTVISRRTELIAWYLRRGYAPTGETRPFPYGDERFGRPRRPDLAFVVLTKALSATFG
jgi:GNAT superfamily N-acetyltransferase